MTVTVAIEESEHMETLNFRDVVNHIFMQESDNIMGRYLSLLQAVDSFERGPRFKPMLFT